MTTDNWISLATMFVSLILPGILTLLHINNKNSIAQIEQVAQLALQAAQTVAQQANTNADRIAAVESHPAITGITKP